MSTLEAGFRRGEVRKFPDSSLELYPRFGPNREPEKSLGFMLGYNDCLWVFSCPNKDNNLFVEFNKLFFDRDKRYIQSKTDMTEQEIRAFIGKTELLLPDLPHDPGLRENLERHFERAKQVFGEMQRAVQV